MPYSILKIATLVGAARYGTHEADIDTLLTDSRSLAFPETTLFFALRTAVGDGHLYIPQLYSRGVKCFVVDTLPDEWETAFPQATFLKVPHPLKALQRLAERHREEMNCHVVGVTGSNGKTIIKEWLYQLLSRDQHVARSPRSYNSQLGVPLSVWLMRPEHAVAIFEAGISRPGEMASLRDIIQPTLGIMANIGTAHSEHFSSLEEKCLEKLQLMKDCQTLVYDADDALISRCIEQSDFRGTHLTWSRTGAAATVHIQTITRQDAQTHFSFVYQGEVYHTHIPFADEASLQNSLHCLTAALFLGVDPAHLQARLPLLEPVAMRMEVKQGTDENILINDAYNSDLTSLDIALDFMSRRAESSSTDGVKRRKVLVLSDIQQSGVSEAELWRQVADMCSARGVDHFIGVGASIAQVREHFAIPCDLFESTAELLQSGLLDTIADSVILIKGARQFSFEDITAHLSLRVHETTLEVNLAAVSKNLHFYRSHLAPQTKVICMVKAAGYGTGSVEIAKTLQDRGVDYLAVAVADEGVELRKAGITANIMVMNPEKATLHTLFQYNLEPEVYSFSMLEMLIRAAGAEGVTDFPIHLKLDTGMHRLGFSPRRDMPRLIDRLLHQNALTPRSVFSHFVGADSPEFDAFSAQQFRLFTEGAQTLQTAFPHHILRHICNSAGIERFHERHLDMVRLGIGLYGIDPIDNRVLHNVATLRTTILQIHEIPAGESIGYSRRTFTDRPTRIAVLPIGYADGLDRRLGNRIGHCLVNGKPAPYMGNICMDVCMIDVTDIPCSEGDSVEIFGDNLPISTLSDTLGTIPYEILTSVGGRIKRVYLQE